MDNLYTLLRSVDNSCPAQPDTGEAAEILRKKRAYLQEEAKTNPLAREIINGGNVRCDLVDKSGRHQFLAGPATFFRVHELLRQTRKKDHPIQVGNEEIPHNTVVDYLERCIPNMRLHHAPWCSPARYTVSLSIAWASTLLVSHIVGRNADVPTLLDTTVVYYMGLYTTLVAFLYTAFKTNRDVRHSAPWNTALYLDLNVDLVRRDQPIAALAHKDIIPRQGLFKTPDFYYAVALKIESHGFDEQLGAQLRASSRNSAK
jgi:hypothetical protein